MSAEVALKAFRGNASTCSCAVTSAGAGAPNTWFAGDELGRLHTFVIGGESDASEGNLVLENSRPTSYSQVEAVAVGGDGKMVAMASDNILHVNTLEDMMPSNPRAIRCTLPITHIEFSSDDSHM
jgi:hypothetical protein